MLGTWVVTIPPLLVIATVLITHRMLFSFLLGIVSAALIVTNGNVVAASYLALQKLWISTGLAQVTSVQSFFSSWNLLIFIFLITLGILIALLSETGAAQAYIRIVRKKVKSKKAVEVASLLLSLLFFIDDYFSALTVGSVMRPLAHMYKLHPVKLAFLVTAMATPLTILSPISSWVGEIVLQLKQVGIGPESPTTIITADPYMVFLHALPFILYALLLIISTWYIVLRGISYGPMRKFDAIGTGEYYEALNEIDQTSSLFDFLLPLLLLIGGVFCMLLYTGNFFLFGGTNGLADAVKNASVHQSLFTGGIISLTVSIIYFLARKLITPTSLKKCISMGFNLMFPSILMLVCAWALGNILKNDLQTGSYVATIVSTFINLELFPVLCFVFAAIIAMMIGSAWATIGLMFPIIIDMLQKLLLLQPNTPVEAVPLIIPIVGATLSGCVIGTQLSILSDNPIMSSASTGADHLEHVKTMAWYVVPVGVATAAGFTLIGLTGQSLGMEKSLLLSVALGIALSLLLLEMGQYFFGSKK